MATTRPLMQLGIGGLEEIFQKQGKDLTILARLKHELSHRQVPRAVALLERIQQAELALTNLSTHEVDTKSPRSTLLLKTDVQVSSPTEKTVLKIPTLQPDLLSGLDQPSVFKAKKADFLTIPEASQKLIPEPASELVALPQLALEDACKILKVSPGDHWQKVETARQKIVAKSSPVANKDLSAHQLKKLLEEAKNANDAAIVIAARRSGRQ
jgi:hypothetical protein